MRKWHPVLGLFCVLAASAALADVPDIDDPASSQPPPAAMGDHFGTSPWDPPARSDEVFWVDEAPGLDTGCSFRSDGPLVFHIEIDRYIGDRDLLRGQTPELIAPNMRLRMPAWDVDYYFNDPSGYWAPERDRVLFNGHPIGYLTGDNQVWKMNEFDVPTEYIEFPEHAGDTAVNEIVIEIDTANVGVGEGWCTSIDWAALEVDVARPVLFVHGIFSSGEGAFSGPWIDELQAKGLPIHYDLNMGNLESIAHNAGMIADKVAYLKNLWNVDKVNIVAHSKGGIDSRHYAEHADDVSQVIQIATPNGGSPLADVAQVGLVVGTGFLGSALVNGLAGPAGIQLTTVHMAGYNLFHGHNADVRYSALAGVYDFDCPWYRPLCNVHLRPLSNIVGPGDLVVPEWSVHVLPYPAEDTFRTTYLDLNATHIRINHSQDAFNRLQDEVAWRSLAAPAPVTPLPPRTATQAAAVTQGGSNRHEVSIDGADEVSILVLYPSGSLDVVLESPSGTVIDAAAAEAGPDMGWGDGEIVGGRSQAFAILDPEPGVWGVTVTGSNVVEPDGQTPYNLSCWLPGSAVDIVAEAVEDFVGVNTPITFTASLQEAGAPRPGSTLTANVLRPDNVTFDVALADDGASDDGIAGNGVYGGSFDETTVPGYYRIQLTGTDDPGAATVNREAFDLVLVSASHSDLNGMYGEQLQDTDGDGYTDILQIDVGLAIDLAGTYRVAGRLADSAGNEMESAAIATLDAGSHVVGLPFDGATLFRNGIDGPYTVQEIWLTEETADGEFPVAHASTVFATAAHPYTSFQHGLIWLAGSNSAVPVDTDGDGDYDLLQVGMDVHFTNGGTFHWTARLEDASGNDIGFASGYGVTSAGVNTLALAFDGGPIGANGVDGPFIVRDLLLYSATESFIASEVFATAAFAARDFEGFVGDPTPPIVTVTSPLDAGVYYYGTPIDFIFGAEDPESGIASLQAVLDGSVEIQQGESRLVSSIGSHDLIVRATNGQGNTTTRSVRFEVGTTPVDGCRWETATELLANLSVNGVAWGDYNNDGYEDLFVARNGLSVLFRNDAGILNRVTGWPVEEADSRSAVWGDANGDGNLDLYVVNFSQPNILHVGDGHGGFAAVDAGDANDPGEGYNAAWADVDNDGDLDLYVANTNGLSRLFRNAGGTFVSDSGVTTIEGSCRGCAFGDYDNDGDQDLYVSVAGANRLFRNDGDGGFTDVTTAPVGNAAYGKGVAWGDYDNDGHLDLYLVNSGGSNRLFKGDGSGGFVDVTDEVTGIMAAGRSCAWFDYDNDGWLDLVVTTADGQNRLLHNTGGAFADSTCGVLGDYATMPVWGGGVADYDNDGDQDLVWAGYGSGAQTVLITNSLPVSGKAGWLQVGLEGTASNRLGVGARISVAIGEAKIIREISAGSGYLGQSALLASFGLGDAPWADVTVIWPSGREQTLTGVMPNQRLAIVEATGLSAVGDPTPAAGPFYAVCYPNPFNPSTKIAFRLPEAATVDLAIYDLRGRLVRTLIQRETREAGYHEVRWHGEDGTDNAVPSGIYFYRLQAGEHRATGRMLLLK